MVEGVACAAAPLDTMNDWLRNMTWRDAERRRIETPTIERIATLKADEGRGEVWHASFNGQPVVIKLRRYRSLRLMVGRTLLRQEGLMMRWAADAGLPVPCVIAEGRGGLPGLTWREALVMERIEGELLRDRVRAAAAAGDAKALDAAADVFTRLLGRIRHAGFCDFDAGVGNVMIRKGEPVWIDLEAATNVVWYTKKGSHVTLPTESMGSAALVSWWVNSRGDQRSYERVFHWFMERCMNAPDVIPDFEEVVERFVSVEVEKQIKYGRIDRAPAPLKDD